MRRIFAIMAVILCMTFSPVAQAEGCTHGNAQWVMSDITYEYIDETQHRVTPVVAEKLYCPDCGKNVKISDMDASVIYSRAENTVNEARATLLADDVGDSDEEIASFMQMMEMVKKYDEGQAAFLKWMAKEGHRYAAAPSLDGHVYDETNRCACGAVKPGETHIVSGSEKLCMNLGNALKITLQDDSAKSWKADSSKVVELSNDGTIRAAKVGKTTVTLKTTGGQKYKLTINVVNANNPQDIRIFEISPLSMKVGDSLTLTPVLSPSNAATTLSWKSSKSKVASIDDYGTVKAKKAGDATITVRTSNGKKAELKVTVSNRQ